MSSKVKVAETKKRVRDEAKVWRTLSAERKVEIITAMGFTPLGESHQPDCPYAHDAGLRCNCIPPATVWGQPRDVDELRHEAAKKPRAIPEVERW